MKNRMNKLAGKMNSMMICAHAALTDRRGEGYVDTAVKILMAVVIGALVLAGLCSPIIAAVREHAGF